MDSLNSQDDGGPRSPVRTLRILELVAEANGSLTLAQLSQRMAIPKTSAYSLLRPLVAHNYLVYADKKYWLGPATFRLTFMANRSSLLGSLHPLMEQLSDTISETVSLSMLDPTERVIEYMSVVESNKSIRYVVKTGTRRPLYCVSSGIVLLAWQEDAWIDDYLKTTEFHQFTAATETDPKRLRRRLSDVREKGYVISVGEFSEDVYGFSAPVFSHQDRVVAALGIGAPSSRAFQHKEFYLGLLIETARKMSQLFQGDIERGPRVPRTNDTGAAVASSA